MSNSELDKLLRDCSGAARPKSSARRGKTAKLVKLAVMPTLNPDAAGADIGAREIVVCVPADRDSRPVRTFKTFTEDLHKLARWLKRCGIKSIAMESTGMYWIPLYQILESSGIEVLLVNARHVKHVPGRKSDVSDSQWIAHLHAVGLLNGSFRPAGDICAMRSLTRHRESVLRQAADQVRHMQKCLDQMNLQIHHVISDLTGTTGMAIIEAIVAGERDARTLAALRDHRIKAARATIEKSLCGDWREEHLLVLGLALEAWKTHRSQIARLDGEIRRRVDALEARVDAAEKPRPPRAGRRTVSANEPADAESLEDGFYRALGTDLTAVPGISALTVQAFLSEVGPDLDGFATAGRFVSWLGLCPGTKISGGKVLDARSRRGKPRFALLLRQAAQSLHRSKSALGARYRRMRARLGAPKALTAMAHCLARIIYRLVTRSEIYSESVFADEEAAHARRQQARLIRQAKEMGYDLVPVATN
ncbi:IS110 family transposase [Algiphilus sp.]|uniref:IS110 family transposase n=1 Tax=Algiphilus sp. TaxID=1872431 RepID=UPI0025C2804F|nr:IS110 family transposase [Algiphilus sp.]MCK5772139.1 IS110 family transposase [Algiphilus sp.]